jgi:hypothetical protein
VVRKAVQNGTLGQLLAKQKQSRASTDARAATAAGEAAHYVYAPDSFASVCKLEKVLPLDTVWCALCTLPKRGEEIAITVGGEAFCTTCDHIRRRANNLGLATKDVTSAYRCGSLAGLFGLSNDALRVQIGAHEGRAIGVPPPGVVGKAGTLGRMCRMCRQVRAPITGAPFSAVVLSLSGRGLRHTACTSERVPLRICHAFVTHVKVTLVCRCRCVR